MPTKHSKQHAKETGALIAEYTAGPVFMNTESKGSHEWIIEFEKNPDLDIEQFTDILDNTSNRSILIMKPKGIRILILVRPVVQAGSQRNFQ